MITAINSTTYSANDLGDVKPTIKIGGSDKSKFCPNINMSFHSDEFYINLNRKDKTVKSETASLASGKVSQKVGDDTDEYYIKDGRLKWDIVFSECPKSMTLEWELQHTDGIEFFYQGELTEEEIKDGMSRPDDIVGSYAVYCSRANNKYKTGKLCHIPRPFVIDADGKKEWATIEIKSKKLTVTLPEKFMSSAIYPVSLDPTFGYTTVGASESGANGLRINCDDYVMTTDGVTISVYAYSYLGSAGSGTLYAGYYDNDAGAPSTAHKATLTINSTTQQWVSGSVSGSLTNGSEYYPALAKNDSNIKIRYDSVGARWTSSAYTDLVDNPTGLTSGTYSFSLYIEYTENGRPVETITIKQDVVRGL